MRLIVSRAFVLTLALLFLVQPAVSTQIIYQSVEQLGSSASEIVRGTVDGIRSYWNEDRTKIFTETTINLDETYKGTAAGSVRIIQLGGTVDNVRVTAHGALSWKKGEEVLLFLEPASRGTYQVSGFSQGKFHIQRDEMNGNLYVVRPALEDAMYIGAPGDETAVGRMERVRLEAFVDEALGERKPIRQD